MKRMHVHVSVAEIDKAVGFYSALFADKPAVVKDDYAKWMLDDPAGISWETFHTADDNISYGDGSGEYEARVAHAKTCCVPQVAPTSAAVSACCK